MSSIGEPWWTCLAAAVHKGARQVVTGYPVPPGIALVFGAGGGPALGQRVPIRAPGWRFAGEDLVARLAAPLHKNYPAVALISDLNQPGGPGALSPWPWPGTAWVRGRAERSSRAGE